MYKAVLFDFDGTLANDLIFFVKAYNFALRRFDIHISEKEIPETCFHKTEKIIAANFNIPPDEFKKYFFQGVKELINDVPVFPDAIALLDNLQKKNIKLGLISLARTWYIEKMLLQTGLERFFQSVIGYDDIKNAKPHPESILVSCKRLGVRIEDTICVGDARGDMLMGKAAACDTALFLPDANKDYCNFEDLKALKPNYVFYNYQELEEILL